MLAKVANAAGVESESWPALGDAGSEGDEDDDEDDDPIRISMSELISEGHVTVLGGLSASASVSLSAPAPARDAPVAGRAQGATSSGGGGGGGVASETASTVASGVVAASTVETPPDSSIETFLEIDASYDYPGFVWCNPAAFPESEDEEEEEEVVEESKEETEAAEEKDGELPKSASTAAASLQVSVYSIPLSL